MEGKKPWRAAEIEAMEEAGALGDISKEELGTYVYPKKLDNGKSVECKVRVYPMHVQKLMKRWPERKQRKRQWFSVKKAAKSVREPELRRLLRALENKKDRKPVVKLLRQTA